MQVIRAILLHHTPFPFLLCPNFAKGHETDWCNVSNCPVFTVTADRNVAVSSQGKRLADSLGNSSTMAPRASTPRTPVTARTLTNVVGGERHRRVSRKSMPTRRHSSGSKTNLQPPPLTPMRSSRQRLSAARLSSSQHPSPARPRRFRPGTRAIMEIRQFQRTTSLLIRRLPFTRLVKEVSQRYHHAMRYVSHPIFVKIPFHDYLSPALNPLKISYH